MSSFGPHGHSLGSRAGSNCGFRVRRFTFYGAPSGGRGPILWETDSDKHLMAGFESNDRAYSVGRGHDVLAQCLSLQHVSQLEPYGAEPAACWSSSRGERKARERVIWDLNRKWDSLEGSDLNHV